MKITIEEIGAGEVILSNDGLDNYNYVDVILGGKEITVNVDELVSAAKAFQEINLDQLKREKLLK